jgi:sugar phosphate isomerase/epimerase
VTRREALLAPAAFSLATATRPIRFGGPIFLRSDDPAELAREHRRLGYSAAYCPKIPIADRDRIRATEAAFQKENVVLAEVGVWVNLLDPDPATRAENLRKVTEGMALADEVGARCCVDIAGSYNPKVWYGPHPKNTSKEFFDATVENVRKIVDAVKPKRSAFSLEIMGWSLPDGPDTYLDLIRAVSRKSFAVHLDVCNGINSPARFYANAEFTRECFRKLGPHIVSCHAKDLAWLPEMNVHFVEVIPGRGEVDYRPILSELAQLPVDAPLMMEHLKTAEEYAEGQRHILKIAAEVGVKIA